MKEQRWGSVGRVEEGSDEGAAVGNSAVGRVEEGSDEGAAVGNSG